jgi:UDP-N-acetyl-D-mannosaminuronate dehydrogenase
MWRIIAWGLAIYFVANAIGSIFERITGVGETFVYESSCLGGKTHDMNKCTEEDGRIYVYKRRFKVDFNHQRVIEDNTLLPSKEECRVFDSDNWHCLSQDGSYYADMRNGRYSDSGYYEINTNRTMLKQTSVIVYWYYYWKRFFG